MIPSTNASPVIPAIAPSTTASNMTVFQQFACRTTPRETTHEFFRIAAVGRPTAGPGPGGRALAGHGGRNGRERARCSRLTNGLSESAYAGAVGRGARGL